MCSSTCGGTFASLQCSVSGCDVSFILALRREQGLRAPSQTSYAPYWRDGPSGVVVRHRCWAEPAGVGAYGRAVKVTGFCACALSVGVWMTPWLVLEAASDAVQRSGMELLQERRALATVPAVIVAITCAGEVWRRRLPCRMKAVGWGMARAALCEPGPSWGADV